MSDAKDKDVENEKDKENLTFDVAEARTHFPALGAPTPEQIYFDNAGGSQVLRTVVDSYDVDF